MDMKEYYQEIWERAGVNSDEALSHLQFYRNKGSRNFALIKVSGRCIEESMGSLVPQILDL